MAVAIKLRCFVVDITVDITTFHFLTTAIQGKHPMSVSSIGDEPNTVPSTHDIQSSRDRVSEDLKAASTATPAAQAVESILTALFVVAVLESTRQHTAYRLPAGY